MKKLKNLKISNIFENFTKTSKITKIMKILKIVFLALSKNISPVSMEYVVFAEAKVGQAKKQTSKSGIVPVLGEYAGRFSQSLPFARNTYVYEPQKRTPHGNRCRF